MIDQQQYQKALRDIEGGSFYDGFLSLTSLYKAADTNERESMLTMLKDVFYFPNQDALRENYEKNCIILREYPYWFGAKAPDFDDLDVLVFPISGKVCFLFNKAEDTFSEIEIDSDKETKYFFEGLSKPPLVENEANAYNLRFLVDNIRASEDVAMDNHIYLYYTSPDILFCAMQAMDFAPLIEKQKIDFLVGKNERTVYPINFVREYSINYNLMKPVPIRLDEMNRLCFWYKHAYAGTQLCVSTLSSNSNIIGCSGFGFHSTAFARSPSFQNGIIDKSSKITWEQLEEFFGSSDSVNSIPNIDGVIDFAKAVFKDKEFFTPSELFKAYFIFQVDKKKANPRVIPVIFYDPHMWHMNIYEGILEDFKYLTVLTSFREPIVTFARCYEYGLVIWNEFQTKYILMSEYYHTHFLSEKFYDRYYSFRFEDLKLYPKEMLKTICALLNIPFEKKMLSVEAPATDKQGETITGFDLKPLKRDISHIFSEFDRMRLNIFYAPIHKYYGYDYFDAEEYKLEDEDVAKLFSYPFRFEINGDMRARYSLDELEADTLRKWLFDSLVHGFMLGKEGKFVLPKLLKPNGDIYNE